MKRRRLRIALILAQLRWKHLAYVEYSGDVLLVGYKLGKMFVVCGSGKTPIDAHRYTGTPYSCNLYLKNLDLE